MTVPCVTRSLLWLKPLGIRGLTTVGCGRPFLLVTRMGAAPLLHMKGSLWSAEVIPVRDFAQPAALANGFTGAPTVRLGTVILVITVAVIRTEQLAAMTARTSAGVGIHYEQNPTRQRREVKQKARINVKEKSSRMSDKHFANVNLCNEIWTATLLAICGRHEEAFRMRNSRKRSVFHTPPFIILNGANTTLH